MRYLLLFLLCLLPVGLAHADATAPRPALLDQVLQQLARHGKVRANFTQTRENPALAQPQASHGDLLFVVGHGMIWHMREPLEDTLVMTPSGASRIDANGDIAPVRDGNRGVTQVSQMLQSMLAGNADEPLRQFDVTVEGSLAHWSMRFTPRQSRMAKVLAAIQLSGNEYLQAIDVELRSGEATRIRFENTRDAGELTGVEQRALGGP
ncbi:outer membrane lipoprotein-sorting protein [Luteibacter sp. Sphag1AF]|uniref:LolA family protein n=1 Tax=Luteibacter sp. Sphag1AF TaxID=2587031 RepID=UPI0016171A81|nr:outer membrane lipoprotein carrier protein LolA [Luteibacter sp. Sphag1AF]MBB3227259.1 outer membrane lipoprotein-sorting protein [Luteibacter sp. Sphag1AF]